MKQIWNVTRYSLHLMWRYTEWETWPKEECCQKERRKSICICKLLLRRCREFALVCDFQYAAVYARHTWKRDVNLEKKANYNKPPRTLKLECTPRNLFWHMGPIALLGYKYTSTSTCMEPLNQLIKTSRSSLVQLVNLFTPVALHTKEAKTSYVRGYLKRAVVPSSKWTKCTKMMSCFYSFKPRKLQVTLYVWLCVGFFVHKPPTLGKTGQRFLKRSGSLGGHGKFRYV